MCSRKRTKYQDQNGENRSGRKRVAEEGKRIITAGELLRHDARADHGGEQKREPLA